jgi:hypothetical protein
MICHFMQVHESLCAQVDAQVEELPITSVLDVDASRGVASAGLSLRAKITPLAALYSVQFHHYSSAAT